MTTFDTQLTSRQMVAKSTCAFHFSKPAGFVFKPGQAIDLVLALPGGRGETGRHAFSLVSAPYERELVIATRMRDSAYKHALDSLAVGSTVKIDGPFGSLALHSDPGRPAVFIAGGIGITPFMSMFRQASHDGLTRKLALVYSNRDTEDAAFLDELQKMAKHSKTCKVIATMTNSRVSNPPWEGRVGRIDENLIASVASDDVAPVYYLVGPPELVTSLRDVLNRMDVPAEDIRSEEFFGY